MAFIIMTVLICISGWVAWVLCKQEIRKCYEKKEEAEDAEEKTKLELQVECKTCPTDKKLLIYMMISTVLNIALMAMSYYLYHDKVIYAFKLAMIFQWIVVIAYVDFHAFIIPNRMILIGMGMAICFTAVEILLAGYPIFLSLKDYFFGFLLGALVFLISGFVLKGSVGMGDVKLFATLGLLLGCTSVFSLLFFTLCVSAIVGIGLMIAKRGNKETLLPLAPFTYAGMVLVLVMGI